MQHAPSQSYSIGSTASVCHISIRSIARWGHQRAAHCYRPMASMAKDGEISPGDNIQHEMLSTHVMPHKMPYFIMLQHPLYIQMSTYNWVITTR